MVAYGHQEIEGPAEIELEELLIAVAAGHERPTQVIDGVDAARRPRHIVDVLETPMDDLDLRTRDELCPRIVR